MVKMLLIIVQRLETRRYCLVTVELLIVDKKFRLQKIFSFQTEEGELEVTAQRYVNIENKSVQRQSCSESRRFGQPRKVRYSFPGKNSLSLSLSLSVVLSSPPPHCVLKANNNTKR